MQRILLFCITIFLLACGVSNLSLTNPTPLPTSTIVVAKFNTPEPTPTSSPTPTLSPTPTYTPLPPNTPTPVLIPTETPTEGPTPDPSPTSAPAAPTEAPPTSPPEPPLAPDIDFVVRFVQLRTNEENSWDGTLGPGACGSDHSIYVHVADAQERRLDGVLIGDKFGNFEVPTGTDGFGAVRILVWSATMELAVVGHGDGTRYTSQFTPPLSTLDEQIPLDWLQEAGYCASPEDCQWRVANNQLCRGHYSYDVIFQRTW